MDRNVFLAVLAMDSYNRGYDRALMLDETAGTHLGDAEIVTTDGGLDAQGVGFYAIAYNLFGDKIISFRGTDQNISLPWDPTGSDIVNGYGVGAGSPYGDQAGRAIDFFRHVASLVGGDAQGANITTTGHSLGGGMAGFTASLYGVSGVLFDNMAFELAADRGHSYSTRFLSPDTDLRDRIYGSETPQAPDASFIDAFATTGEFLATNRILQSLPVTYLDSNGGLQSPFVLHSIALHVALQWASSEELTDWIPAGRKLWNAFFDSKIADTFSGSSALIGPNGSPKDRAHSDTIRKLVVHGRGEAAKKENLRAVETRFLDGNTAEPYKNYSPANSPSA